MITFWWARCGLGWGNIPRPLKVSVDTLKRFAQRITRLYEQDADEDRIGGHVWHWCRWVRAGVTLQLKPFKVWGHREKFPLYPLIFSQLSPQFFY